MAFCAPAAGVGVAGVLESGQLIQRWRPNLGAMQQA